MCLSGAAIFWPFCLRFRFREQELLWRYASTGVVLLVAGTYSCHIGIPIQYYQHFIYFALLKASYISEENLEQRIQHLSASLDWGWEEQLMSSQSEAWASLQRSQLSIPEISLALAKSLNAKSIVDG